MRLPSTLFIPPTSGFLLGGSMGGVGGLTKRDLVLEMMAPWVRFIDLGYHFAYFRGPCM